MPFDVFCEFDPEQEEAAHAWRLELCTLFAASPEVANLGDDGGDTQV